MSNIFFEEMNIPMPKYSLSLGGGSHATMTGRQLEAIEKILLTESPDIVLVYGDTNSTIAGALSAAKIHIPVAHIEAGLRSYNMVMPEEINRVLTDNISTHLFCPTETAVNNLRREGFEQKECSIINVGDVMYDAVLYYTEKSQRPTTLHQKFNGDFILATLHRADNTDDPQKLKEIISSLNELAKSQPVVCPLHPRTRKKIAELKLNCKFTVLDPVSYFEMLWLLINSKIVLTDSGGLQKEAYFFEKFCITMREQTEWVELVDEGVNVLVGSSKTMILNETRNLLEKKFVASSTLYGDGTAGEKIVKSIGLI
jgi:UDP-GlcNAc3NAcA epimerase